jgi:hypothetical protein
MRRAFSAIFGRFFARAYLCHSHGFVWFHPLDGPFQQITPRLRVQSRRPRLGLPDWICAGRGQLALAEAKGARSGGHLSYYSQPGPIKSAENQLNNCRVSIFDRTSRRWIDRNVKGWAILNQWSFQTSNFPPYLFVVDPETDGAPMPREELPAAIRAIARAHVGGLLRGLGLFGVAGSISQASISSFERAPSETVELVSPAIVSVVGLDGSTATGRFFRAGYIDAFSDLFGHEFFVGVQNSACPVRVYSEARMD